MDDNEITYCNNIFAYSRFQTRVVHIGDIPLGGEYPVRVQSMTNTNTLDTVATVAQTIQLANAGCDYVRITAPGMTEARNMLNIRRELRKVGCKIPLIADIHFNPKVAEFLAAGVVEKVRINPGNYVDKKSFRQLDYNEQEYQNEIERIAQRFTPLVKICKQYGTAMRIGSNHGSLSDRIMSRYGDTPQGMVESAMEFVRICQLHDYHDIVLSMKASNLKIMVYAYRLLMHRMIEEGMNYPLHLGVTEAGEGFEGRIKSAAGIGVLLEDGIGDTIRVSLTEDPLNEVPFAKKIVERFNNRSLQLPDSLNPQGFKNPEGLVKAIKSPFEYLKRETIKTGQFGGGQHPVVIQHDVDAEILNHSMKIQLNLLESQSFHKNRAFIEELNIKGNRNPVVFHYKSTCSDADTFTVGASVLAGGLLIDGNLDGIWLENPNFSIEKCTSTALAILQATGDRIEKTEYVSCPTCGRTSYNIQQTLKEIKEKTIHLKGLKIAVMGCIVNGPGEMADADYGYVGSGNGKITLYKGKQIIEKNIDENLGVERLIAIIKANDQWTEPK